MADKDDTIRTLVANLSAIWCTCTGETDVQDAMTDVEKLAEIERIAGETLTEYENSLPCQQNGLFLFSEPEVVR